MLAQLGNWFDDYNTQAPVCYPASSFGASRALCSSLSRRRALASFTAAFAFPTVSWAARAFGTSCRICRPRSESSRRSWLREGDGGCGGVTGGFCTRQPADPSDDANDAERREHGVYRRPGTSTPQQSRPLRTTGGQSEARVTRGASHAPHATAAFVRGTASDGRRIRRSSRPPPRWPRTGVPRGVLYRGRAHPTREGR